MNNKYYIGFDVLGLGRRILGIYKSRIFKDKDKCNMDYYEDLIQTIENGNYKVVLDDEIIWFESMNDKRGIRDFMLKYLKKRKDNRNLFLALEVEV